MIQRCCLLIAIFIGAFGARATLDSPTPVTTAEPLVQFPSELGSWRGQDAVLEPEVVKVAAVDDYLNRYYRSAAGELGLYVGYYESQRQGESLHSPLFCLPGAGWQPIRHGEVALRDAKNSSVRTVNELVVERGLDRLLVLYWYQTVNRITASEYGRKLFQIHDAFFSGRTDVALVRIIAPVVAHDHAAEAKSADLARPFAELVLPQVQERLFPQ
jgi:EpsI family protein